MKKLILKFAYNCKVLQIVKTRLKKKTGTFSGGPVVKNPPSNAGDTSLIPGLGTKIPQATRQLSPCVKTAEPVPARVHVPQLEGSMRCNKDPAQPKKKKIKENKIWRIHTFWFQSYSVQFSHSVVSDSLRLHESQHSRPPCPSPTPRVYSDSCPSSR